MQLRGLVPLMDMDLAKQTHTKSAMCSVPVQEATKYCPHVNQNGSGAARRVLPDMPTDPCAHAITLAHDPSPHLARTTPKPNPNDDQSVSTPVPEHSSPWAHPN